MWQLMQAIDTYVSKLNQKYLDLKVIFCGDFNARIGNFGGFLILKIVLLIFLRSKLIEVLSIQ